MSARVRGVARSVFNSARNLRDRALHERRHAAICQQMLEAVAPRSILVVCHGNIIRSPYLAALLERTLPGIAVSSAGFFGSDRPVPDVALALASKRGLDLSGHRSRPLTKWAVDHADIVIVMDGDQARHLTGLFPGVSRRIAIAGDLDPRFDSSRGITDPWNKPAKVFESSFDRLDRCATTLGDLIRRRGIGTRSRNVRTGY